MIIDRETIETLVGTKISKIDLYQKAFTHKSALKENENLEGMLVIIGIILWIGWRVLTARSESEELSRLARKRHGANDHKSNIADW